MHSGNLVTNDNNPGSVGAQTENSFSKNSLEQKIESLGKEIKSLRKQNQLNSGIIGLGVIGLIGYIIATNWSAIVPALVAAGTAIAAAAPVIGIAIGAIIGAAVLVGASYAIWKYRAQIKAGFKYAAEKTVDGAKYTAGKIKDGAVHAKDKVKEGYEHSVNSLKKGASFVGEGVANKFHKASGETDYLDKIKRFTPDAIKKSDEIRNDMKAIFADKGNNSGLVENILSGISSEIDLKMAEKAKSGEIEHTSGWQVQKEFINNLNEKSLHSLLTQRSLPKGSYFIDSVFSDHHDEIKRIIGECKREYEFDQSMRRNNAKDAEERKASKSFSLSSVFSLRRKDPTQSTSSLSKSSSLDFVRTDSTVSSEAELLNPAEHKKVKQSSGFFSRVKRNELLKEATNIKYQAFSEPDTSSGRVGESAFYVAPPKPPRSNSLNSIGTVSTATVSDSGSQEFATVRRSSSSSSLTPKLTPVASPKVPRSPSTPSELDRLSFTDYLCNASVKLQEQGYFGGQARQQATHSMPTRQGLPSKEQFNEELEEKLAKRRAVLNGVSLEPITQKVTTV